MSEDSIWARLTWNILSSICTAVTIAGWRVLNVGAFMHAYDTPIDCGLVNGTTMGEATGASQREAGEEAARKALEALEIIAQEQGAGV
jgi:hypothetical protein